MGENKSGLFLIFAVILFILNLELIKTVFSLAKEAFVFELFLFLFLGLMAVDSMREFIKNNTSCFPVLGVYFGINLINAIGLKIFSNQSLNISLVIVASLGFIISVLKIKPRIQRKSIEDTGKLDELKEVIDEGGAYVTEEDEPQEKSVIKEYYPGKFLASKTGKKYHSPKCDFAKKIPKKRHVWFNNKAQAKKKGYKPCKCV